MLKYGHFEMGNGLWEMGNGIWEIVKGRGDILFPLYPIFHFPLPIKDGYPATPLCVLIPAPVFILFDLRHVGVAVTAGYLFLLKPFMFGLEQLLG